MTLQHLRSSTANKRPDPTAMADGQIALNTAAASPGLFYKDSAGNLVKAGPVHVGSTAPNVSPASGGTAGNSTGEAWLDTSGSNPLLKVWNGSSWQTVQPVASGTVVSTADTGSVTSTMIANGTIVDADVNASAAIAGTKVSPNFGSQTITTTGVVSAAAGAAATPSITFTGDTNTGIYSPGADQLALSTNSTQRLLIDSTGNISLGSLGGAAGVTNLRGSSYHQFVVANDLYVDTTPSGGQIIFRRNAGASESMRIDGSGRLGVGTSVPGSGNRLHIADTSKTSTDRTGIKLQTTDALAANTGLPLVWSGNIGNTSDYTWASITGRKENATSGDAAGYLQFATGSSGGAVEEKVRIDSAGRVGIGTSTPDSGLVLTVGATNGYPVMGFQNSGTTYGDIGWQTGLGVVLGARSTTPLLFYTNGSERFRCDSSGRLLVGTSDGSGGVSKLVVQGASNGSAVGVAQISYNGLASAGLGAGTDIGYLRFTDQGSNSGVFAQITATADATSGANDYPGRLVFSTTADGASSPTQRMQINNEGILQVISTSFGFIVSTTGAAGSGSFLISGRNAGTAGSVGSGTVAFTVAANGNVTNTNGSYTAISDAKLKENITDAQSQWDDLKAIRIRNWNFKVETGHETHRQIGPIAQELEAVCPGLVFEIPDLDEEGKETGEVTKGVNQSVLYMKAVKALQEAMERIEQLETEMAAVKAQLP